MSILQDRIVSGGVTFPDERYVNAWEVSKQRYAPREVHLVSDAPFETIFMVNKLKNETFHLIGFP